MHKADVGKYFDPDFRPGCEQGFPCTAVAKALRITKGAVAQWGDLIPEDKAYRLQDLSRKKLKVDRAAYERLRADSAA